MATIQGKKLDNQHTFTLDGQKQNSSVPQIIQLKQVDKQKLLKNSKPSHKLEKTNNENKKQKQSKKAESQIKVPELSVPLTVQKPIEIRPQRRLAPLSEQFPNIMRSLTPQEQQEIKAPKITVIRHRFDDSDEEQSTERRNESYDENEFESSESEDEDIQEQFQKQNQSLVQLQREPEKKQQDLNRKQIQNKSEIIEQEKLLSKPPQPEKHPNHQKQTKDKVEAIVKENNKKFVQSKEEARRQKELERQNKLEVRDKMKKYGKQQITRAHTFKDPFAQKFSWGQNQIREKVEQKKLKIFQEEKKQETEQIRKEREERQKVHKQIQQLFPESINRKSKYREIWEKEARSCSRKKPQKSPQSEKGYFSDPEKEKKPAPPKKKLTEEEKQNVERMIQEKANETLKKQAMEKLREKQTLLIKKHKIDYIDREAKAILSKTKKVPFAPPEKGFDNKVAREIYHLDEDNIIDKAKEKKVGFKENNEEDSEVSQQIQVQNINTNPRSKNIVGGQIMGQKEAEKFLKQQQKKSKKIQKYKSQLSNSDLKLKPADPLTKKETQVKRELDQDKKLLEQIEYERQKQLMKIGVKGKTDEKKKQQHRNQKIIPDMDLGEFILDEANIPHLNVPQVRGYDGEDYEFRERVEQEIKSQVLKQKQKSKSKGKDQSVKVIEQPPKKYKENTEEIRRMYKIDPDMPPPLELRKRAQKIKEIGEQKIKRVYKSQEPKDFDVEIEPRYPLYHDLGETNMLDEDYYKAQHQIGQIGQSRKNKFQDDSEAEEDREFIQKSGFYNDIIPFKKVDQHNVREVEEVHRQKQSRNKTVTFQEPRSGYKTDDSSKIIDAVQTGKRSFVDLINKQKHNNLTGKFTTDDDTDDEYLLKINNQVWHTTDPFDRDIFTLSAKELMELPELNL